jgi:hypothetical protein
MREENRYIKYQTYKKIDICYDKLFKVWICYQMDFSAYTKQELKNYISAEHRMNMEAGQCKLLIYDK